MHLVIVMTYVIPLRDGMGVREMNSTLAKVFLYTGKNKWILQFFPSSLKYCCNLQEHAVLVVLYSALLSAQCQPTQNEGIALGDYKLRQIIIIIIITQSIYIAPHEEQSAKCHSTQWWGCREINSTLTTVNGGFIHRGKQMNSIYFSFLFLNIVAWGYCASTLLSAQCQPS